MLKLTKVGPRQTASLEACGGAVMLALDDGEGHAFRQALDAHDAGKAIAVCGAYSNEEPVCQGDLWIETTPDGINLTWPHDGGNARVHLPAADMFVFEEALKSYCRMLMRPEGDEP